MSNPAVEMLKEKTKSLEQSSKAAMADAERAALELVARLGASGKLDEALELAIFDGDCVDYHRKAVIDWKGLPTEAGAIVEQSVREGLVDDKFLETPKQLAERASRGIMEIAHEQPRANPHAHERRHSMERELFAYRSQMANHRIGATDECGAPVSRPTLSEQWREELANRVEQGLEREAPAYAQAMAGVGDGLAMLGTRREAFERIERNDRQAEKNMKAIARIESGREDRREPAADRAQPDEARAPDAALRTAEAELKLIGALERSGLLDAFIDQTLARAGMSDHYRDTKLMGGATTSGKAVRDYLGSSLNIAANDAHHDTPKKQAEGHSMQAMLEAHGDAASHERDAGPRVAGQQKKQAEIALYQYRQSLADHVIAEREYANLTRGMDAAQIALEGYAKPAKPELPDSWREAVCEEAAMTAMGRREAGREAGADGRPGQDWPWSKLLGQDRGIALEAMVERQAAIKASALARRERSASVDAAKKAELGAQAGDRGDSSSSASVLKGLIAGLERDAPRARQAERGA